MIIRWYGQSCFLITAKSGTRILMDPYADMLGYKLPHIDADIVTISHDHRDHNNMGAVNWDCEKIDCTGTFSVAGIKIKGIETFHDKVSGNKKGKNTVYNLNIDGLNVCHCGDLGHTLNTGQIEEIGKANILLLPVGGKVTLDASDAVSVMKQLNPTVVIPMHYRTKALGLPGLIFGTVDQFISVSMRSALKVKELDIDLSNINDKAGIIVLDYR